MILPPTEIVMRDYQQVAINDTDQLLATPGNNTVITVLPTGAGKCHGLNTPILMHDGSVKMVQDVVVGDLLMGPDSRPRKVLTLARGVDNMYKVTPVKGEPYVVNESHILSLKQTGLSSNPVYKSQEGKGRIVNVSVKDYLSKSKHFKHIHKGWRTGVSFVRKPTDVYLPPYFLGVWLGDGCSRSPMITSADREIIEYIHDFAEATGQDVKFIPCDDNKADSYRLTNKRLRSNNTCQSLKKYDLILNKHIPDNYKLNDEENRLELLAGILDSDGYLNPHNYYDLVFKVKRLADDVVFLARSLGFAAYIKPCRKTCTNTGATGDYYRISITGDVNRIPTRLSRHQPGPRKQIKSVLVTGIKVEPVGVDNYYGFEIDGDHLYLLGDFTVTHNSLVKSYYARRYYERGELTIIFAHRDVLLGQISDKCCLMKVPHTFICSDKTRRNITNDNLSKYGDSYWDENSHVIVVSVPTFLARIKSGIITREFCDSVKHWMLDEAHHLLSSDVYNDCDGDIDAMWEAVRSGEGKLGNQWGVCTELLSNARGLGVTATPKRGDKKGLGSHADGHADAMSVTTTMFDLIKGGHLTPYEIYTTGTIDVKGIKHNKDGDLNNKQLYIKTKEAGITGDAVVEYRKHLDGKPVITFCVNVEHAKEVTKAFNDAGIPSMMVNANTADAIRQKAVADLRDGRILNLVNVDLFGEGFDAPAVAGVIMMRRTESYSLFKQQFGRMLRPAPGKSAGVLIDMVGNVKYFMVEYGLTAPHDDPEWTLDNERQNKKSQGGDDDGEERPETITCGNKMCMAFGLLPVKPEQVEKFRGTALLFIDGKCPKCGWCESEKEKTERKTELKYQKGDLVKLELSVIDELIKQRDHALMDITEFGRTVNGAGFADAAKAQFARRQHALNVLRFKIQKWCEVTGTKTGQAVPLVQADFEIKFGVNIFKAQAGTASEMERLAGDIEKELVRL